MFHCGLCKRLTVPGEKGRRIPVETRERVYPYRRGAHVFWSGSTRVWREEQKMLVRDDPGGVGRETVQEVLACERCAAPGEFVEFYAPIINRLHTTLKGE